MDNFTQNKDKKIDAADKYKTYRARCARLAAVQANYEFDFLKTQKKYQEQSSLFQDQSTQATDKDLLKKSLEDIIFFYKMYFFPQNYGKESKNTKVDEIFAMRLIENTNYNIIKIDNMITSKLKEDWTISRLDSLMRAVLRTCLAEAIMLPDTERSILTAEYTEIASKFFTGKMIGFANGILDSCLKEHKDSKK